MKNINLILILLSVCVCFTIKAEEEKKLYKWTDLQGNVHYSDLPVKGAEEIEMKLAPVTKLSPVVNTPTLKNKADSNPQDQEYTSLSFSNIADNGVIRNNSNSVELVANVQPQLAEGDKVRFFLDGALITTEDGATSVTAEGIELGQHSASFIVVNQQGKQLKASDTIHFQLLNRINPQIKQKQQSGQN